MSQVTIYFVRHGQTMFNFENKVQGWGDSFLTPEGIKGVQKLGQHWKNTKQQFDAIFSSDSGRTLQTAQVILDEMGIRNSIKRTPGIREYNFGYFEGMDEAYLLTEIAEHYKNNGIEVEGTPHFDEQTINVIAELDRLKKEEETNTWYAENAEEYGKRLERAITDIVNESLNFGHKEVLAVSHGMTISILSAMLFKDELNLKELEGIANASVTKIVYDKGMFKLEYFGKSI